MKFLFYVKGFKSIMVLIINSLSKFHDIVVICAESRRPDEKIWFLDSVKVIIIPEYRRRNLLNILTMRSWKKIINNENPDYIYHNVDQPYFTLLTNLLSDRYKVISVFHDPRNHSGEDFMHYNLMRRLSLKTSHLILCHSKAMYLLAKEIYGQNLNVKYIKFGNSDYLIDENIKPLNSFKNRVLFFGQISKYKGIDIFVECAKIVNLQLKDSMFYIFGRGKFSRSIASELKLSRNIKVHNKFVPENLLHSIFNTFDLVLLPYRDATQSGIVPIAHSFGKPVISTDVGAMSEYINHDKTGYIVKSHNPQVIADAVIRYLKLPKIDKINKESHIRDLSKKNTWDIFCKRLNRLLVK